MREEYRKPEQLSKGGITVIGIFTKWRVWAFLISLVLTIILEVINKYLLAAEYRFDIMSFALLAAVLTLTLSLLEYIVTHERRDANIEENIRKSLEISEISSSLLNIARKENRFVELFTTKWRLNQFISDLKSIQKDFIILKSAEVFRVPTDWVGLTNDRIRAVSYMASIHVPWGSRVGHDFLNAQIEAAKREVDVKRVFIFGTKEDFESFNESGILQRHAEYFPRGTRITTQRILEDDQKKAGLPPEIKSVVLFDEGLGGEIDTNPDLSPKKVIFRTDEEYRQGLKKYFEHAWALGCNYNDTAAVENLPFG